MNDQPTRAKMTRREEKKKKRRIFLHACIHNKQITDRRQERKKNEQLIQLKFKEDDEHQSSTEVIFDSAMAFVQVEQKTLVSTSDAFLSSDFSNFSPVVFEFSDIYPIVSVAKANATDLHVSQRFVVGRTRFQRPCPSDSIASSNTDAEQHSLFIGCIVIDPFDVCPLDLRRF